MRQCKGTHRAFIISISTQSTKRKRLQRCNLCIIAHYERGRRARPNAAGTLSMDPFIKKAVIFLVIFVILSVAQKLTGFGTQPQLNCQLRNTLQIQTSVKRSRDAGSIGGSDTGSESGAMSRLFGGTLGKIDRALRGLCKRDSLLMEPILRASSSTTPCRQGFNVRTTSSSTNRGRISSSNVFD